MKPKNEADGEDKRKLAGFWKQILILFWKNGKLFKRNKLGTFAELFMALLFILMLLIIRYFVDSTTVTVDTDTSLKSNPLLPIVAPIRLMKGTSCVYYYPNNNLIKNLVTNAMADLTGVNASFNPSSKILF